MKTILVIENDDSLREKTCDILTFGGYHVIMADNGITGLQQAMSYLPDLILCNIGLPRMNGYDFFKTIQQIKSTSAIPLIFMTAQSEKDEFREGMNLGADDYITKPFDHKELLSSIKTRLDKLERIQQNNNKRLYSLIDNPLTGVFIYSKNKFDFVNEKCSKIFGLSPDDLSKMTFQNLVSGSDKDKVLEKIERCFSDVQDNLHIRFLARHMKGEHEIAVEMYASIVNFKGSDSLAGYMSECASVNNA
jgi:PAS domain S-box-containing protein